MASILKQPPSPSSKVVREVLAQGLEQDPGLSDCFKAPPPALNSPAAGSKGTELGSGKEALPHGHTLGPDASQLPCC